jgi:hypothetical protein
MTAALGQHVGLSVGLGVRGKWAFAGVPGCWCWCSLFALLAAMTLVSVLGLTKVPYLTVALPGQRRR